MSRPRLLALPLAAALLAAAAPPPPPGDAGGWLERLQRRLDGVRAFRARFVQEYEPRAFSRRQEERGVVTFRRPDRMRWEYRWPDEKLALCDGERVWVYYPAEKRAEVDRLAELGDQAPVVQILLGRWRLAERFRLEGIERRGGEVTLHLAPSGDLEPLRALRLTVSGEDLTPRGLEAEETTGNVLRYRFEGWEEGIDPAEDLFRFRPPEGVEVVESPPAGPPARP